MILRTLINTLLLLRITMQKKKTFIEYKTILLYDFNIILMAYARLKTFGQYFYKLKKILIVMSSIFA